MKKRIAEVFPPAAFIKEEMAARNWTETYVCEKSGISRKRLRDILSVSVCVNKKDALRLGLAFGTSGNYWLNLQTLWYTGLAIAIEEEDTEVNHG
jgi:HTH-type transcriptional regulator/antitoxin HigA